MIKITASVEGMACGMCEAHINEAVRNAFPVKKVTSSHTKKQTVIIVESDVDEQKLKEVIAKSGYEVVSVSSDLMKRKGCFQLSEGNAEQSVKKQKYAQERRKYCEKYIFHRQISASAKIHGLSKNGGLLLR